jgi:hypothetical protein
MGGLWSGKRWSKKSVVEDCLSLDTADLKRWEMLTPNTANRTGSLQWTRGGNFKSSMGYALTTGETGGTLRLQYELSNTKEPLDYPVRLVTTGCHLGGVRWWFICPLVTNNVRCGRRVRKLYLQGKYFGCRHCHGLTYTSSQESDSRVYAALRDPDRDFGDPSRMSISELGFALKVLTFERKQLDKLDKRSNRRRSREDS